MSKIRNKIKEYTSLSPEYIRATDDEIDKALLTATIEAIVDYLEERE